MHRNVTCPTGDACIEAEHSNRHKVKTENNNSGAFEGESAPWVSPMIMTTAAKEQEVIWKGHRTTLELFSFKAFQLDAITSVELKKGVVVIQPIGAGKSLCYQLPALFD